MSRAPESTSYVAATNAAGTVTLLSRTRACVEVRRARWKYQSTGVARNSLTASRRELGVGHRQHEARVR